MGKQFIEDLDISISLATKPVSQAGFGVPLILGSRSAGALIGKFQNFSDLTSMVTAGFATTDPEYKMAAKIFAQSPCPDTIAVYIRDSDDEQIDAAINKIADEDWYILLISDRDKASLHAAGDAVAALDKLFIGCTSDITALEGRKNIREAYCIHTDAANFPECALVGMNVPKTPGSYTWKWKSPTGVIASTFTKTELLQIRAGHGFTMSERAGVVYTDEGITTGGEYIDIIQIRDYVKARLGEDIFALMINNDKISFSNRGFAKIESALRNRFRICGENHQIAEVVSEEDKEYSDEGKYQYTVTVPERNSISKNDRAARKIPGIEFEFIADGAVHEVGIKGIINV